MTNNQEKLRQIREEYSNKVVEARNNQVAHSAYLNLNSENANASEELVRRAVLKYGELGLLDVAAKYISDAQTVKAASRSSKKDYPLDRYTGCQ